MPLFIYSSAVKPVHIKTCVELCESLKAEFIVTRSNFHTIFLESKEKLLSICVDKIPVCEKLEVKNLHLDTTLTQMTVRNMTVM